MSHKNNYFKCIYSQPHKVACTHFTMTLKCFWDMLFGKVALCDKNRNTDFQFQICLPQIPSISLDICLTFKKKNIKKRAHIILRKRNGKLFRMKAQKKIYKSFFQNFNIYSAAIAWDFSTKPYCFCANRVN